MYICRLLCHLAVNAFINQANYPTPVSFYAVRQSYRLQFLITMSVPVRLMYIFRKVLCNNPKKYAVVEPEGRILGQKCVDIVVRWVCCLVGMLSKIRRTKSLKNNNFKKTI